MNSRIYLSSPHMTGGEMRYIQEAFDTNWVAPLGANVNGLESDLKAFTGAANVTALSAGTAALHLAMILSGVGPGDKVFCQSLTFSASVNPVRYLGGDPVFIDSERDTWNMDPDALRRAFALYGQPRAVVAVHLYGVPAKLDEICAICAEHGVPLIEDAAEALGSEYHGRKCGTFGRFGILSFNGNKIITTSGGGALLSREAADAAHALKLATQAREPFPWYQHEEIGYNYRMSNICAGIGRGQMPALPLRVEQKRHIFDTYRRELDGLPLSFLTEPEGTHPNRWLTVILLDKDCGKEPMDLQNALAADNIEARPLWKPMHLQPVFRACPYVDNGGVSEDLFRRGFCLPSDTKMTPGDLARVCKIIKGMF